MHHVSVEQTMERRNARLIVRTATNRACFGDEAFAVESTLITTCRVHFLLVTAEGVAVAVPAARAGRVERLEAVLVEHAHAVRAALRVRSECREYMYGRESRGDWCTILAMVSISPHWSQNGSKIIPHLWSHLSCGMYMYA